MSGTDTNDDSYFVDTFIFIMHLIVQIQVIFGRVVHDQAVVFFKGNCVVSVVFAAAEKRSSFRFLIIL